MIKVSNLNKTFEVKTKGRGLKGFFNTKTEIFTAVKNVNFEIEKGEKIGFIGPNGAGKSTTIKMLTGIIARTSGDVSVLSMDPSIDRKKLSYKIGCMFGQKSNLWMHLPAIDSYKLLGAIYDIPDNEVKSRISELVELFGIEKLINSPVRKLSLGERMICEIAATMIHKPEIIFLDEPTIGLDIVAKQKVRDIISTVNKESNTTIFLTSHDISDVEKLCDRVIIIDNGTLIKDDSTANLKAKYITKRIVSIIFDTNVEKIEFNYPVIYKEGSVIKIGVDTKEQNVFSVLEMFSQYGHIVDTKIEEESLERVIYDVYTGRG